MRYRTEKTYFAAAKDNQREATYGQRKSENMNRRKVGIRIIVEKTPDSVYPPES